MFKNQMRSESTQAKDVTKDLFEIFCMINSGEKTQINKILFVSLTFLIVLFVFKEIKCKCISHISLKVSERHMNCSS